MKIAVNTRLLLKNGLEGIGWFSFETLKRITQQHREHEFIFIFDRPFSEEFIFSDNITPVIAYPPARHPILWYAFFDWGIPSVLRKHQADLFFSPDGWLSLRTNVPSLPVVHDLNFLHNPQWVEPLPRLYYQYFFPKFIKKAVRIATVSEFSKHDIVERYNLSSELIDVVYNGANENYTPIESGQQQEVRNKYTNGQAYFLFVGLVHPRKNLTRILKAFDRFKAQTGSTMKFVVVGSTAYWTSDTREAYERSAYKSDIVFLGRLEWEELHKVLASCFSLVFASLFEGFGIPILEAMYCEKPVITSNVTSMPEVGGDAALMVDPYNVDQITAAMVQLYKEEGLASKLIERGKEQRLKFKWDRTAERMWSSIEKVLANH